MIACVERPGPLLLASVCETGEATLAAEVGADIIDCKDPRAGALGALPLATVAEILSVVPRGLPVSATIGDLPCREDVIAPAVSAMAATGVDYVKIGFFGDGDPPGTIDRLGRLDVGGCRLVGVLLADRGIDLAVLPAMAGAGFAAVMLDTADKRSGGLVEVADASTLAGFVETARGLGLGVGLAGALRLRHIPRLLTLKPDILGFRGALCHNDDRRSSLDREALARVRSALGKPGPELRSQVLEEHAT